MTFSVLFICLILLVKVPELLLDVDIKVVVEVQEIDWVSILLCEVHNEYVIISNPCYLQVDNKWVDDCVLTSSLLGVCDLSPVHTFSNINSDVFLLSLLVHVVLDDFKDGVWILSNYNLCVFLVILVEFLNGSLKDEWFLLLLFLILSIIVFITKASVTISISVSIVDNSWFAFCL